MRSSGVISNDPATVREFRAAAGEIPGAADARFHQTSSRDGGTHVACVFGSDVYPPVTVATSDDGSFCLVDGEIYDTGSNAPPAQVLLESGKDISTALANIDATAMVVHFDAASARLVVARDPLGTGSAFFSVAESTLYWASSLTELRQLTEPSEVDRDALDFMIATGYVPSPWTLTSAHRRLGPGELAAWHNGRTEVRRYFTLVGESEASGDEARLALLDEHLPASLRRRVPDPDRTGVLLSGGADSALLLGLFRREFGQAPQSFTFHYSGYSGHLNEGDHARTVAAAVGSEHSEIVVHPDQIPENLPRLLRVFGEPFAHGLHTTMLGPIAELGLVDLLSGNGADSLWMEGQGRNALRFQELPAIARKTLRGMSSALHVASGAWSRRTMGGTLPLAGEFEASLHGGIWTAETSRGFLTSDFVLRYPLRRSLYRDANLAEHARKAKRQLFSDELARMSELPLDMRIWLNGMRFFLADSANNWNLHAGRAYGLAIRQPYTTRALLEDWVAHRTNEGNKPAIRQYAATLLPDGLENAPKVFQGVPILEWFRGPLREWIEDVLHPANLDKWGMFDPKMVGELVRAHMTGRRDHQWILWNVAAATVWESGLRHA